MTVLFIFYRETVTQITLYNITIQLTVCSSFQSLSNCSMFYRLSKCNPKLKYSFESDLVKVDRWFKLVTVFDNFFFYVYYRIRDCFAVFIPFHQQFLGPNDLFRAITDQAHR